MLVTTAMSGAAASDSGAISPGSLIPISSTQARASSGMRSTDSGRPIRLFIVPTVA